MGAGRDVDEVILVLRIKGVVLREVEELRVHRAEVPGLREFREVDIYLGVRRHLFEVGCQLLPKPLILFLTEELKAVDEEIIMLPDRHRGPPPLPPVLPAPGVERRPREPNHNRFLSHRTDPI